ncbi:hypothetical protein [Halorarius halobius]|uniref:hypothetical protein n=1 Tax=Halorarius halobius TaxID=2962671 RepID=UPI0020CBB4BB|nr:hypothetical protein [Halorarius halobius]
MDTTDIVQRALILPFLLGLLGVFVFGGRYTGVGHLDSPATVLGFGEYDTAGFVVSVVLLLGSAYLFSYVTPESELEELDESSTE